MPKNYIDIEENLVNNIFGKSNGESFLLYPFIIISFIVVLCLAICSLLFYCLLRSQT